MKYLLILLLIIAARTVHAAEIDHVLVKKSERELLLMSGTKVVKSYPISLGDQPIGHKQREGDERTPEGQYTLDWRNPDSRFYKSIRISYPNDADQLRAQERNHSPGGDIFIHGLPNGISRLASTFKGRNWTDGCIAVNDNDHMEEIWQLVKDGTRITIRP